MNQSASDSLAEVVSRLKQELATSETYRFPMEEVEKRYRSLTGRPIPYGKLGVSSLKELLELHCDFCTVMANASGQLEVFLDPPRYQESPRNTLEETSPVQPVHGDLFEAVHNELPQKFVRYLKMFINKIGKDGISVSEFEQQFNEESYTQLDYKGFSREHFFRGLSDVFDVCRVDDILMLYPVKATKPQSASGRAESAFAPPQQHHHHHSVASASKVALNIPDSFQKVLGHKIQECAAKFPRGVTFDEFRAHFNATSPRPLDTNGLSDDQFFSGLPHIFRVNRQERVTRLLPAAAAAAATQGKCGLARNNASTKSQSASAINVRSSHDNYSWRSSQAAVNNTNVESGQKNKQQPYAQHSANQHSSRAVGNRGKPRYDQQQQHQQQQQQQRQQQKQQQQQQQQAPKTPAVMTMLSEGQQMWVVSVDRTSFVPTGCIAKLAGLGTDTVLDTLHRCYLRPTVCKKLEDENTKVVLIRNGVGEAEITMLPLRAVPAILRVLMGSRTNESLITEVRQMANN